MSKSNRTITIQDVAQRSGFSVGTVDRVLHNRGAVSEKTSKKILKVIEEIGYQPNMYASILSQRKKSYTVVAILPYFQKGEYWELVYKGVMKAIEQVRGMNVVMKVFYYNQFEAKSFRAACRNAIETKPSGVVLAPLFKQDGQALVGKLREMSIPVAYIDSRLTNTDYLVYFGMAMFESGYVAADVLVGTDSTVKEVVSFNIERDEDNPSDSMIQRHKGFMAYLADHNPGCRLVDCTMSPYDFLHNINVFDDFFRQHPSTDRIVTFNSRAHIISDWMEIRKVQDKRLVGFDILQNNIRALKNGTITNLIAERSDMEAYNTVKTLVDHLVLRQLPARKDNYSSIDILNRYNVDFYLRDFDN